MGTRVPKPRRETQDRRAEFFADASQFTPMFVADGPCRFLVETSDNGVGRQLFVKGSRREFDTLEKVTTLAGDTRKRKGQTRTFLDIGANIGTTVVTALCAFDFSDAVACEPWPRNFRLLRANLALNDVDERATTLRVAVSDREGSVSLALHPANSGAHRVLVDGGSPKPAAYDETTVDAVTVDLLVERALLDPERVGLVWMDVQGHEAQVLLGATSLREVGAPVVLEFHPRLLRAASGLDRLRDVITDGYSHFVDLRKRDVTYQPVRQLDGLVEVLDSREGHTDLLLVRKTTRSEAAR